MDDLEIKRVAYDALPDPDSYPTDEIVICVMDDYHIKKQEEAANSQSPINHSEVKYRKKRNWLKQGVWYFVEITRRNAV